MRTISHPDSFAGLALCLAIVTLSCAPKASHRDAGAASDAANTARASITKDREFIASAADFTGFMAWRRIDLGDLAIGGHPSGHRFVYVNQPIPPGKTAYRTGTIVVHAVARDPDPLRWELFAMVKRGGVFNYDRARGWEFFVLRVDSSNHAIIEARGTDPHSAHENQYVSGEGGCNSCHGHVDAREVDGMISRALQPGG